MGIKGLLPCLQSITKNVSLENYRGLTAAVDAMCWLHKGVFTGDVQALAKYQFQVSEQEHQHQQEQNQENSNSHQEQRHESQQDDDEFVKRINFDQFATARKPKNQHMQSATIGPSVEAKMAMTKCADYVIRHSQRVSNEYGVELILVIDGGSLPSKKSINEKRRFDRADAYQNGLQADKRGDKREARKQFSRACSISHEIRRELISQCEQKGIPFIVAPYEADAQLAQLAHSGAAELVITEDSDLLAYACPRVLFKIDLKTGRGDEIQVMRDLAFNDPLSFRNWNHDMFVYMCILSGCDYCEGIPGIGIQTAHKLVRIHRSPSKIFRSLRAAGKLPVGFEESFWIAYRTFRHQRIYCPDKRAIEPLFPIQEKGDHKAMWDFAGPWLEASIGNGIAEGRLHPSKHISWKELDANMAQRQVVTHPTRNSGNRENDTSSSKNPSSSKDGMFAFFKPKRGKNGAEEKLKAQRLPLLEVHLNQNDYSIHPPHGNSVPSNFHDYSSNFVATSFQTLSRNSKSSRLIQKRKGVSKAISKLKNKLSLKKVLENENAKRIERAAACTLQKPAMKIARHNGDDGTTCSTSKQNSFAGSVSEKRDNNAMSSTPSHHEDASSCFDISEPHFDYNPPPYHCDEVNVQALQNFDDEDDSVSSRDHHRRKRSAHTHIHDDENYINGGGQTYFPSEHTDFTCLDEFETTNPYNIHSIESSGRRFESMRFDELEVRKSVQENNLRVTDNCSSRFSTQFDNPFDQVQEKFDYGNFSDTGDIFEEGDDSDIPQCQGDNWSNAYNTIDCRRPETCFEDIDVFRHL
jgi:exonuclease-1